MYECVGGGGGGGVFQGVKDLWSQKISFNGFFQKSMGVLGSAKIQRKINDIKSIPKFKS